MALGSVRRGDLGWWQLGRRALISLQEVPYVWPLDWCTEVLLILPDLWGYHTPNLSTSEPHHQHEQKLPNSVYSGWGLGEPAVLSYAIYLDDFSATAPDSA